MDITESKRDLHVIIEQIPDDSLEEARMLLKEMVESMERRGPGYYDDEPVTEEDEEDILAAEEDINAGRVKPWSRAKALL